MPLEESLLESLLLESLSLVLSLLSPSLLLHVSSVWHDSREARSGALKCDTHSETFTYRSIGIALVRLREEVCLHQLYIALQPIYDMATNLGLVLSGLD